MKWRVANYSLYSLVKGKEERKKRKRYEVKVIKSTQEICEWSKITFEKIDVLIV